MLSALDPAGLACLAALADGGTFERAAQSLTITQSAVSQRLRTLEQRVGRPLVVRSRPLRLTEAGKVLLRYARHLQALRAEAARELGFALSRDERVPIAVNADSLATWVIPALNDLVHEGQRHGWGIELMVDDQDFTHEWLLQGQVLGCVTTVDEPLRGCIMQPLGAMRYLAVTAPSFAAQHLPAGLTPGNFAQQPFIAFNRKDDMQTQWVGKAFGLNRPRLRERFVPSSDAVLRAAIMGWGIAVLPELMARDSLLRGVLLALKPTVTLDVELYWHQWRAESDPAQMVSSQQGLLARIGEAVGAGSTLALTQARTP